jgi:hypothetical protein
MSATSELLPGRPVAPPAGYTLVLPPGWRQVPVRSGSRQAISKIVKDAFRVPPKNVSRDKLTPYRIALERRLTAAVDQARRCGGTEVYLPVEPVHGTILAASFVVSEGYAGADGLYDPSMITPSAVATDAKSALVTLDGARAVRRETVALPDPRSGAEHGSRRVDYLVQVPGGDGHWLIFAFSALGAGDPGDEFSGILVELFDAIISTFRWARPEALTE